MPPDLATLARFTASLHHAVRGFFVDRGFLEVFTPSLVPNPGMEPNLDAFAVHASAGGFDGTRWLHTSPELAIKATLSRVGADVFTLARCYRDDPPSRWHHAEFTMLEWYRVGASTDALVADCEALLRHCADRVGLDAQVRHPDLDAVLDLTSAFDRVDLGQAFVEHTGIDPIAAGDDLTAHAVAAGLDVDPSWDRDTAFTVLWADRVEPSLGAPRPSVLDGFDARDAALARRRPDAPHLADRFELYVAADAGEFGTGVTGIELANAFGELVDPVEQRARFAHDLERRRASGRPAYPMPEAMLAGLDALEPTAGIALGVERLGVWLAEWRHGWRLDVRDLLLGEPPGPHRSAP